VVKKKLGTQVKLSENIDMKIWFSRFWHWNDFWCSVIEDACMWSLRIYKD